MPIVDSQIHIWENETMSANHRQVRTYSMEDALAEMAAAGVDAALLHPPSSLPKTNATAIDAARQHPDKFAILGHFDLADPVKRGVVETWKQQQGMLGFRFTFSKPAQRAWWDDNTLDWFWAAAEKADTPVGLLAGVISVPSRAWRNVIPGYDCISTITVAAVEQPAGSRLTICPTWRHWLDSPMWESKFRGRRVTRRRHIRSAICMIRRNGFSIRSGRAAYSRPLTAGLWPLV